MITAKQSARFDLMAGEYLRAQTCPAIRFGLAKVSKIKVNVYVIYLRQNSPIVLCY
jgi:hypothetical protein